MIDIIKKLTLDDNKKCRICENVAWYLVVNSPFCERHMVGFMEFHEDMMKFQDENK
jgi:hypothetical protein